MRRPDGSTGIFGVAEKPHFVVLVPRHADGSLQLVEQYRYPVGRRFRQLPQGAREHIPDADLLQVPVGELREETGLIAASLTVAGHLKDAATIAALGLMGSQGRLSDLP